MTTARVLAERARTGVPVQGTDGSGPPREPMVARITIAFIAMVGLAACDRCYGLRLTSATGEDPRRISRDYVRTYGCGELGAMRTIDDMIPWCVEHQLGDTVASDVIPGCRPGETPGGCERFWICE